MKLNFNIINKKKNKEKENSKLLERILIEYFSDYFENIEFDYNIGRDGFTFLAKEVEFRRDLLQKFGIPLELSTGKIKFIKLSVKSLITLKNFIMEISDIDVEVQTIHISKDYKKNFINYRQKFLDEWEAKHKKFFNSMTKHSILESFIIDRLIPIKLEVKNINIKINDSISSKKSIKQIEIRIDSIHSLGCNSKWEEIEELEKDDKIYRTLEINNMGIVLNKIEKNENIFLGTLINEFNLAVKVAILRNKKNCDLKVVPQLKLEILLTSPLIVNLSVFNINILKNLLTYLAKVKKAEKYWVNRPEFPEDGKISQTDSLKWFLYAFRVLREEIRNNKRQNFELSTLIEKIVSMEKYIQFYKESHKLIIAPWIHQKDHKVELQNLENKMPLEDIIYCREIAFAELLTEGRAFCASGEVGEGYKPFVHLWEFYVNDLRTKWMNKDENEITTIKLSAQERRELMTLWKKDRDMVLLSYIKGEPNHPKDIIIDCELKMNLIIVNFSKYIDFSTSYELQSHYLNIEEYASSLFNSKVKTKLISDMKFSKAANMITREQIETYLKDDLQNDINNDSDDEAMQLDYTIQSKTHNSLKEKNSDKNEILNLQSVNEESCVYIDEILIDNVDSKKQNDSKQNEDFFDRDIGHAGSISLKRKKSFNKAAKQAKEKRIYNKALFSLLLFSSAGTSNMRRNDECTITFDVANFFIFDHNFTYINVNKKTSYYNERELKRRFKNIFFSEKKSDILEEETTTEQLNDKLIDYLIDLLRQSKCRNSLLIEHFKEENTFLNLYEDAFGFKKCETANQGLVSLKNHFTNIVVDYLIKKNTFSNLRDEVNNILASRKKKFDKYTENEKNDLLKKVLIKAFENYINPENKRFYEGNIQEKFIHTMVSDLNLIFEITTLNLIKYVITSLYMFFINEDSFSKLLGDHLKTFSDYYSNQSHGKDSNFLSVRLKRKGRSYPNYIMKNDSDYMKQYDLPNDDPNTSIKVNMNTDIDIMITNELISEMNLVLPELTKNEKSAYVGDILNDLTRSYLNIFDDFRELRAKLSVLKNIEKKYKNEENKETPIEILYLNNLKKHLRELSNKCYDLDFILKKDKQISVTIYDKVFFIEKEKLSCVGLCMSEISMFNRNLLEIPIKNMAKMKRTLDTVLSENYDMDKVCKILYITTLAINSIEIYLDNYVPIMSTDININYIYSIMPNTLFFPDAIIDAHTNKLEFNIYPCVLKMLKNIQNLNFYKSLYNVPSRGNTHLKKSHNRAKIIKNNFGRFIRNLSVYFGKSCCYKDENSESELNNLEYYLENRNNQIIMYSLGNSEDEAKGIFFKVFSTDAGYKENFSYKPVKTVCSRLFKGNSTSKALTERARNNTVVNKGRDSEMYLDENISVSHLLSPFFSFKCDFLLYNSRTNLFYQSSQLWLCPIKVEENQYYEKFIIDLCDCEPFKFNANELMFCKAFISSLKEENILVEKNNPETGVQFPYLSNIKLVGMDLNCFYHQTTFFYEESKELRDIYLRHFTPLIDNFEVAKYSKYLSNMKISINSIDASIVINNNKSLIDYFYGWQENGALYKNEVFKTFINERNISSLANSQAKIPFRTSQRLSIRKGGEKEYIINVPKISVHMNEVNVNNISFSCYYYDNNEKPSDNLYLSFQIKTIKYTENNEKEKEESQEILKANLFILSTLFKISIPKNFDNLEDFDDPDRVPIFDREYIKNKFKTMKEDKSTDDEKIIIHFKNSSLKLFNEYKVIFDILNSIHIGFAHGDDNNIDEEMLWILPYPNGTEKEKEYVQSKIKMVKSIFLDDLDTSFCKALEIKFDKIEEKELDDNIKNYDPINHFSNMKKMMYIIQSTFQYQMIYFAEAKGNIGGMEVPSRAYDYLYYFENWKKKITKMIHENHPIKEEKKKVTVNIENENENKVEEISSGRLTEKEENSKTSQIYGNEEGEESFAPLEGENNVILSLESMLLFLTFKQGREPFSHFIYLKNRCELYKNSNNEKLFYFGCVDLHWKVNDCKMENLIIKNNPKDKKGKLLEIRLLLDNSKAINLANKTEHSFFIDFSDCTVVFLMKYFGECLTFLDVNEECSQEFPKKAQVWSMLPKQKSNKERFYYNFTRFSVLVPECSLSQNYVKFSCSKGFLKISLVVDESKIVIIPSTQKKEKGIHIIDKNTFFGLQAQKATNKNTKIEAIGNFNEMNECLLYITELSSEFSDVDSEIFVGGVKYSFLQGDNIKITMRNPKTDLVPTKVYMYYWSVMKDRVIKWKNSMNVNMTDATLSINFGNFFTIDHFIDNNFDEESPIFPEIQPLFKHMEFEVNFDEAGTAEVGLYKVFKNFFDKSQKLQRIGQKLPGYADEIIYDTTL